MVGLRARARASGRGRREASDPVAQAPGAPAADRETTDELVAWSGPVHWAASLGALVAVVLVSAALPFAFGVIAHAGDRFVVPFMTPHRLIVGAFIAGEVGVLVYARQRRRRKAPR